MKHKFSRVVAIITLVLIAASMICTIVGAFLSGTVGQGLLWSGIFGFVAFAIFGWILIQVYERVHRDEDVNEELLKKAKTSEEEK